jgi:NTE family protein
MQPFTLAADFDGFWPDGDIARMRESGLNLGNWAGKREMTMVRNMGMRFWFRRIFYFGMILGLIIVFGMDACRAEDSTGPAERPKLGLALGGGSAAGFAHIGVLKWLEENRVPVDYIAGTSMGGLIGGCYAMGMSPEEIRSLVCDVDWSKIFDPNPPYEALDFRRKEDRHDYPAPIEAGLRDGQFKLPGGLNVYQVGFIFSRITLPYSTLKNFDELPIPFRCMATDIRNAQSVVIGEGSLAEAFRATMAIPGIFSPVERGGQLLVDGGVLDNMPTGIVKQMGANIIVAVKVNPFDSKREAESVDSVLMGTIDTVIEANGRDSLNLANVALTPDTNRLGLFNWEKADEYIELGYQAAKAQASALQRYSVDAVLWEKYLRQRQSRYRLSIPIPAAIEVNGASPAREAKIKKQLHKYIGEPLDTGLLEKDLTAIIGSGLFENIFYKFRIIDGKPVLMINVKEKIYGPPFIKLGFQFSAAGISTGNSVNTVQSRMTAFDIAGPGSELRLDMGIGTAFNFHSELYKPVGDSQWFIAPVAYFEQENHSLFTVGDPLTCYQALDEGFQLDLGYSFNNSLEIRLGYALEYQGLQTRIGVPLTGNFDGIIHRSSLKWALRQADDASLLRKGLNWDFNADWFFLAPGTSVEFGMMENKLLWSIPAGSGDMIYVKVDAGASLNGSPPLPQKFRLGGPFQLSAYHVDEFQGDNYLLGCVGYLKTLGRLPLTGDMVYLGVFAENGGVFDAWPGYEPTWDLSAGLVSGTILGPVYVGVSYGKDSRVMLNLELGKVF